MTAAPCATATPPRWSSAGSASASTGARGPARPTARGSTRSPSASSQVARLIVDRRTNAQIAAELFLSPKTVESHIRNLFHKLGVSSRVDVARAVERADRGA